MPASRVMFSLSCASWCLIGMLSLVDKGQRKRIADVAEKSRRRPLARNDGARDIYREALNRHVRHRRCGFGYSNIFHLVSDLLIQGGLIYGAHVDGCHRRSYRGPSPSVALFPQAKDQASLNGPVSKKRSPDPFFTPSVFPHLHLSPQHSLLNTFI